VLHLLTYVDWNAVLTRTSVVSDAFPQRWIYFI